MKPVAKTGLLNASTNVTLSSNAFPADRADVKLVTKELIGPGNTDMLQLYMNETPFQAAETVTKRAARFSVKELNCKEQLCEPKRYDSTYNTQGTLADL
jgi:hypothetical protein